MKLVPRFFLSPCFRTRRGAEAGGHEGEEHQSCGEEQHAIDFLFASLRQESNYVGMVCVNVVSNQLAREGDTEVVKRLRDEEVVNSSHGAVRVAALQALGAIAPMDDLETLAFLEKTALEHGKFSMERAAVKGLVVFAARAARRSGHEDVRERVVAKLIEVRRINIERKDGRNMKEEVEVGLIEVDLLAKLLRTLASAKSSTDAAPRRSWQSVPLHVDAASCVNMQWVRLLPQLAFRGDLENHAEIVSLFVAFLNEDRYRKRGIGIFNGRILGVAAKALVTFAKRATSANKDAVRGRVVEELERVEATRPVTYESGGDESIVYLRKALVELGERKESLSA